MTSPGVRAYDDLQRRIRIQLRYCHGVRELVAAIPARLGRSIQNGQVGPSIVIRDQSDDEFVLAITIDVGYGKYRSLDIQAADRAVVSSRSGTTAERGDLPAAVGLQSAPTDRARRSSSPNYQAAWGKLHAGASASRTRSITSLPPMTVSTARSGRNKSGQRAGGDRLGDPVTIEIADHGTP